MTEISVVVPAYNEEENIEDLLEMLYKQTKRPDEIIIVDAGSVDSTISLAKKWLREHVDMNVNIVELKKRAYPGLARNQGVIHANKDFIAFMDCGVIFPDNWLSTLSKAILCNHNTDMIFCKPGYSAKNNWEEYFAAVVEKRSGGRSIPGSCILKETFKKIGGFRDDLRAGEDILFLKHLDMLGLTSKTIDIEILYSGYPKTCKAAFKNGCCIANIASTLGYILVSWLWLYLSSLCFYLYFSILLYLVIKF
jgi:glycosyltransferase involved in cell wall biosynthesis